MLLTLGAWLMLGAEPPEHERPDVRMPTRQSRDEALRSASRTTLLVAAPDAGPGIAAPLTRRDPLLAIMPPTVKRVAMVAEINAIVSSELGGMMMSCLFDGSDQLARFRDAGLDPMTTFDRLAFIDDSLVLTGNFKNAAWRQFAPSNALSTGYGKQGELIEWAEEDGGTDSFATWGGQMFIAADSPAEAKAIIDRLEGSGPTVPGVLDESMAYGEMYGVVAGNEMARLIGRADPTLGATVRGAAKGAQVHLDVSHDVGMVVDIDSNNPAAAEDLRKAMSSGLSLARVQAKARGDSSLEVLDLAKVHGASGGSGFRLEAGMPHEQLKKYLQQCIDAKQNRVR